MVREIRGAKINPKSSFKIRVRKIRGGGNYASKYGISVFYTFLHNGKVVFVTSKSFNFSSTARYHEQLELPSCMFCEICLRHCYFCLRPKFMNLSFSLALNYVPKLTHISQPETSSLCCAPLFFYQKP